MNSEVQPAIMIYLASHVNRIGIDS